MGRALKLTRAAPSPHQKAYVCIHVFEHSRPTLLVSRQDGDWCFLCGEVHEENAKSYRVVGIGHVLEHDPSLQEVLDLASDWEAERESVGGAWIRTKCEADG